MKKGVEYLGKEKKYIVKTKLNKKASIIVYIISVILIALGIYVLINKSVSFVSNAKQIDYNENGVVDYKVYLKDNNYYKESFLTKDMQYIASLIKTINADFNYTISSNENIDYEYEYDITGDLQVSDVNNNKILYSNQEQLLKPTKSKTKGDHLIIKEDIDIDYDKYNNYVNNFKKDYLLTVNSKLILTLNVKVKGTLENSTKQINKQNKLQVIIPLSEQTLDININADNLNNKGIIDTKGGVKVTNISSFIISVILIIIGIIIIVYRVYLYIKNRRNDSYTYALNKILREYDRLIVGGTLDIDEEKYPNKIYPTEFTDMVDASEQLEVPILFYEVIPGQKSYFIVAKADTLYKYRITKAYQDKKREIEKLDIAK